MLNALVNLLFSHYTHRLCRLRQSIVSDISIHFFKRLLFRQGIYPTPKVREPILHFDKLHQEIADRHINNIMQIEEALKAQL